MQKKNIQNRWSKFKFGFTMVEIVVAIGVLGIGVVSVSTFFAGSISTTRSASNTSVASNLGQGVIDEELVKAYNQLNIGTGTKTKFSTDPANPFYNFSRQVNISLIDQNLNSSVTDVGLKKIDVIIYWNEGGTEKSSQFSTIKAE